VNAHPLAILMECPVAGCVGQISLRSRGTHGSRATGRCPVCGVKAVLHAGVLELAEASR
jgi:hypothetical protein